MEWFFGDPAPRSVISTRALPGGHGEEAGSPDLLNKPDKIRVPAYWIVLNGITAGIVSLTRPKNPEPSFQNKK